MANNPLKIAQGFPGQMGLLAEQMNRGFGGGLLAQQRYLNDIYDPVVMPQDFFAPEKKKGGKKDNDGKSGGSGGKSGGVPAINTRDPVIMVNGTVQMNPNYIRTRTGGDR